MTHNTMRVSRRLLLWGAAGGASHARHVEGHAAYWERALFNGVLGTQRGTMVGEMTYMYPLGGGVSKAGIPNAGQGHHWSDADHCFWCCQGDATPPVPILCHLGEYLGFLCCEGSGIEAWARVADSTFFEVHLLSYK